MLQDGDGWRRRKTRVTVEQGRTLAVVDTGGEGPAALLLHGYTDTSRSYAPLAVHLHPFRLIVPDLPGHGDSDEDPRANLRTLAEDMHRMAARLKVVPSLLIGHSFGSLLALELARLNIWPAVPTVLLAGSAWPALAGLETLAPIRAFRGQVDLAHPFLDQWYAGPGYLDRRFLERIRAEATGMPVRIWHQYLNLLESADLRSALPAIANPVLSVSGGRDPLFDATHADLLSQGLPRLCDLRLADRGHNPHWEAPEEVAALIGDWLASSTG